MPIDKEKYLNQLNAMGRRPTTRNLAVVAQVLLDTSEILADKLDSMVDAFGDAVSKLGDILEKLGDIEDAIKEQ